MSERDGRGTPPAADRLCTGDPVSAWHEKTARWLIHQAARSAPISLAERLHEEWLADLATRRSAASRLRFALGCCWATRVIALEHAAAAPLATAPLSAKRGGARLSFLQLTPETRFLSRRSLALLVVVCLHVAVFYALLSGLAVRFTKIIPPTTQARLIEEPRPREVVTPLPPPPPPHLTTDKLPLPTMDLPPFDPDPKPTRVDPATLDEAPPMLREPSQSPPAATHFVNRTPGGPGSGFPNADDYYPLLARQLEEQGIGTVHVCIDARGRLSGEPSIVTSTGSKRLDAGALQLAQAGSGHYRPTLEDGRAVNSCYDFRVRFQLKN
jgi:protein TonB